MCCRGTLTRKEQAMQDPSSPGEWAVHYALCGVPVFPLHYPDGGRCSCGREDCSSPAKHPATRNGLLDATTDVEDITKVWGHRPFNIGLATGHVFDVLDIDSDDAIGELQAALGRPILRPADVYAQTGRGYHVLLRPTEHGNRARILPGVDWRGMGGYIVAPPSRHMNGHTYRWGVLGFTAPEAAPDDVLVLLDRPEPKRRSPVDPAFLALVDRLDLQDAGTSLEGVMRTMAEAVEGERNNVLFWCANRVVDDYIAGWFDEDGYDQHLQDLHQVASAVGLGDHEIEQTIASAAAREEEG